MTPVELQCSAILSSAASATFGIIVRTNSPYKARALLYRVRKDIGDSDWNGLHIRVSPDDSEGAIWVIRRSQTPVFSINTIATAEDLL